MKNTIIILFALFSIPAFSGTLCSEWKPEIKERRDEAKFTKENYLKALKGLRFYLDNSGVDPWQHMVMLEGFLLKKAALEELANNKKDIGYSQYCNFIVQQGVHRG